MCRLLILTGLVLSGCSSALKTLPLDASTRPAAARPTDVIAATEALGACAGLRFDASRVLLECLDDQQVFLTRYAADPSPQTCRRLASASVGRAALAAGPVLALPPGSETFTTSLTLSKGLPAHPAVIACAPAPGQGTLLAISILGDAARVLSPLAWDGLPPGLDTPAQPDSVDLFGRTLAVHPSCQLLEPRNLQCASDGQMSWTRFSNASAAQEAVEAHGQRIRTNAAEVLSDERVGCRLEGVATECRRLVVRIPLGTVGRLLTRGQSDRLVGLLATADVRGQHAQVECSFFDDQAAPGTLATLCREAFEIDD